MLNIQKFHKVFTRDNNLIIQSAWNAGYMQDFSGNQNPFQPTNVDYVTDGVVEIWDNDEAVSWFEGQLQKSLLEEGFFEKEMSVYLPIAQKVLSYKRIAHLASVTELKEYIELLRNGTKGFLCFYHAAKDERTPPHIRERALRIRADDSFYDDIHHLTSETLEFLYPHTKGLTISILTNEIEAIPSHKELQQRFDHCIWILGETPRVISFTDFKKEHPEYDFFEDTVTAGNELKGQSAYKGYAKGVVRILKRKNQISELQDGEILVSPMTTSDFIPAMKKAAAVVTDEGGVACHAAVVAREMKKPCVVGTKVATRRFKDGDVVEVDAERGIVRLML